MQSDSPPLIRPNLSEDLASKLREMIVDGGLEAGTRINEVHLADDLGVSRTPLREALSRLATEGSLSIVPRRGFFVRELTFEEFEELYPIRGILDPAALQLAGLPPADRLRRLSALNDEISESGDAEQTIRRDDAWHLELLAGCPNGILIGLIEQFMLRTRRYELAYMRERRNVRTAIKEHRRILRALRAGDLAGACEALRRNMESGKKPILDWLEERQRAGTRGVTRR